MDCSENSDISNLLKLLNLQRQALKQLNILKTDLPAAWLMKSQKKNILNEH